MNKRSKNIYEKGLPASAYTEQSFWQTECDTVLTQYWTFVGFAHELTKVGDVLPVMVAGKPILLVRNQKFEILAFHNACLHRCLKLVDQPKNVGQLIACPYHAWAYDLDGLLVTSPHFSGVGKHCIEGIDIENKKLWSVRVAVWHDWIFVNLSGNAPSFEQYAMPLIKRFNGIDFDKVAVVATLDFGEIATNWKFLMENFIEPYHVQFVHRTTTNQPLRDHHTIIDGACLGSAVDLDEEETNSNSLSVSSRYLTLFPNFVLGRYFPNQLGVHLNVASSPHCVKQKRVIYTTDGKTLTKDEVDNLKTLWWDVHKEDHMICERLQLGRASPVAADGGMLSPCWEDSVHAFQKRILEATQKLTQIK